MTEGRIQQKEAEIKRYASSVYTLFLLRHSKCYTLVSLLGDSRRGACKLEPFPFYLTMKRIYTFTPCSFTADQVYWSRDTGLINRALRRAGVESKCIMPLPWHADDEDREYLLRASQQELHSPAWWRSLKLDWVILYTWADPRYTSIVSAIKRAGIRTFLHMDRGTTLFRPYDPKKNVFSNLYYRFKDMVLNILRNRQMMMADILTMSQPLADVHLKSMCYSSRMQDKIRIFPCPVAAHFVYDGKAKEERVVCVGRWSDDKTDEVKRPEFLRDIAERFVELDQRGILEIYGYCGKSMQDWYAALPDEKKNRISLKGRTPNIELREAYQRAMVSICPSRSEGTHIASAEALNCGASIVTSNRKTLSVLHWYIAMGAGTIAEEDTATAFAKAIHTELERWRSGERDPYRISAHFNQMFHVDKVMSDVFELASPHKPSL